MDDMQKDKVKEQFGKNAQKYYESQTHAKSDDLDLLVEWLKPEKSFTVLDIATGGGHVAKKLATHVETVFATDLTKAMLENTAKQLQAFRNIYYVIADAEELPFLDQSFDIVTCRIAPHHFPNPEKFIDEVARTLKKGGRFLFIDNIVPEDKELGDFMNTFEKLRDNSHVRCLSLEEWTSLFVKNNLHIAQSKKRKKPFDYSVWVKRTTENDEQVEQVRNFMLSRSEKCRSYYQVETSGENITAFAIDECMVMCEKK